MSLPGQLYELQQVDLELQKNHELIEEIILQLSENQALIATESRLASQKEQLADTGKKRKGIEWELEDLQEKAKEINNKLYGGTVKNPKELVNLESEAKSLKKKIERKEDELLELMSQGEDLETEMKDSTKELEKLEQEWQQKQGILNQGKTKAETELARLKQNRGELAHQIGSDTLRLYEQIRLTKVQAVAKIEQGRCQGCHITLPTSHWQRAKAGELVQCNSCGRILYLE